MRWVILYKTHVPHEIITADRYEVEQVLTTFFYGHRAILSVRSVDLHRIEEWTGTEQQRAAVEHYDTFNR